MKSDKLQAAITMIKDEYIEEARCLISGDKTDSGAADASRRTGRSRIRIYLSIGTAAAVLMIAVGVGVNMAGNVTDEKAAFTSGDIANEEYNDAYAEKGLQEKAKSRGIVDNALSANRASDTTSDGIRRESGIGIVMPDGASDVRWTKIDSRNGAEPIYQADYMYGDNAYCFRIQKTGTLKDISDMDYDWSSEDSGNGQTSGTKSDGLGILYIKKMTDEGQGVVYWLVNSGEAGYTCSVSMADSATADKLDVMYRHFTSTVALPEA